MRLHYWCSAATAAAAVAAMIMMAPAPVRGQVKQKSPSNSGKIPAPKGKPTPRTADGKIDFSGVYHAPGYGPGDPRSKTGEGFAHNIANSMAEDDVPMLPWAKEYFHRRFHVEESAFDPEGFCLPMGTPRVNPYPWKIIQDDKLLVILYEGNVHGYRQVFMDGRKHDPAVKETYWGDSIGTWEGDTLVIDTVGLGFGDGKTNRAWLDADGHPRTNQLHVIERFTRPELAKVSVEVTIDDPGAYSKPWKVLQVSQLAPDWDITENICNENQDENGNNQDVRHLVAPHK